jgi:hypothetical protein
MTDEEKAKAISEMGVNWFYNCPHDYGIEDQCMDGAISDVCVYCWIKALEA